jgi:hypothetical protein
MRMSDLIEDCEDALEFGIDEVRSSLRDRAKAAKAYRKSDTGKLNAALKVANQDRSKPCPDGFRRNAQGKCQSAHSLDRESSERSAKAITQYKSMPMGGGEKKPSLVDRMKAMFGKK